MSIKRRSVLLGLPMVGAAAQVGTPAIAQGRHRLTAATAFPVSSEGRGAAARRFARTVEAASGGSLTIELVGSEATGLALYDAVSRGEVDMCFGTEEMWRALNPAFALFASPPGGMTASEFESWIKWGGGQDVWNALAGQAGITPFLIGDSGPSHTLLARPELSMTELAGTVVSASGLAGDLWRRLGAGTVIDAFTDEAATAPADIYNGDDALGALRTHFGHYRARLDAPMNRVNNAISLSVNSEALASLPEDARLVLDLAANREHMAQRIDATMMSHRTAVIVNDLALVRAPAEFSASQSIATNALLAELSDFDALAADAVWSFQLHQEDVAGWSAIGEGAYLEARGAAEGGQ